MQSRTWIASVVACSLAVFLVPVLAQAQDSTVAAEIKATEAGFVKAFNAGQGAELAAHFSPTAEFIDEEGNLYRGTKEITEVLTRYFERFPGAKLALDVESVREIGPNLSIEEGTRYISGTEGVGKATLRYSAVRIKINDRWLIASLREFTADPAPTAHEMLEPLSWMIGDWINEGTDGVVKLSFKWSADQNYILGEYDVTMDGKSVMNSTQRIGWDPLNGRVRSWLFDADGGFSEGMWTGVSDGWVVKSQTTNPDGSSGSATLTLIPGNKNQFVMKGSDRIVGGDRADDFEFTIVRQPPTAKPAGFPGAQPVPATPVRPALPARPATPATPAVRK